MNQSFWKGHQLKHHQLTFGKLLASLDDHASKLWVYAASPRQLSADTECIILDADDADLGSDGFTPLVAEQHGMSEFLSIHDIKMVREYLKNLNADVDIRNEIFAARFYFERDAYPSKADLDAV